MVLPRQTSRPDRAHVGGVADATINGGNYKFDDQVLDGSLGNDVLLAGKRATIEIGGPNDSIRRMTPSGWIIPISQICKA
jgi:hypothetical protein